MNRRPFIKSVALAAVATTSPILGAAPKYALPTKGLLKPPRLQPGDTVTLVAPGGPVTEAKIDLAEHNMRALGFKTKQSANLRARKKHTAGTDEQRLADLHAAFADPETKAIWCVRGGDGCNRLLPQLDYDLISRNPKSLIGFSDITALINAIFRKTGLVGFHGPIGAWNFDDYTVENLQQVLMVGRVDHLIKGTDRTTTIQGGQATGQLVGGNLSLLAAMAGTPYDHDYTDKIVFIEDVGEAPRRIDRMLTQLSQASNLHRASGIIFGEFADCYDNSLRKQLEAELKSKLIDLSQQSVDGTSSDFLQDLQTQINATLKEQRIQQKLAADLKETIIDRFLHGLDVPILYDFPFSHDSNKEFCTFPVGIQVELDATKQLVRLQESAVS